MRPGLRHPRPRSLPREHLSAARHHRHRLPRDPLRRQDDRPAPPAQGDRENLHGEPRARPRHRHHRLRQVDHPRGDDRSHQLEPDLSHHDDRGSDRVPDPRPPFPGEPARDRRGYPELRQRAARGPPAGSRRDPRRRDARLRDHRDRHHRGRDRAPGDEHAPHPRRDRDHQPDHLGVSALPAEAGPSPAEPRS